MRRVKVAEWFLSLFTTTDRASAIAGDLVEQRSATALNILGTSASLLLRSASAQRNRLLLVLPLGAVLWIIAGNIVNIPFRLGLGSYWQGPYLYGVFAWSVGVPALVGYVITLLTRGREITGCVAFAALLALLTFGKAVMGGYVWSTQFARSVLGLELAIPVCILLASGALARRRALSHR